MAPEDIRATNTPQNCDTPQTCGPEGMCGLPETQSEPKAFASESTFTGANSGASLNNDVGNESFGDREQAQSTKEKVRAAGARASEQATAAARDVQQKVRSAADQARRQGSNLLNNQKHRAAEELTNVSSAIRRAADELHSDQDDNLAEYVEMAASQVDGLADYLRDRDIGRMYQDLESTARRRPELFLGGMFLAGLGISRFLKASGRRREPASRPIGY